MFEKQVQNIKFSPPLPCIVQRHGAQCGRPATVATVERFGPTSWIIVPMCRECVAEMAASYGIDGEGEEDD